MKTTFNTLAPLPDALKRPCTSSSNRRRHIGDVEIERDALLHFNELLEYLDLHRMPLECDQVATAARELVDGTHLGRSPRCIQQRMRRGAAIDLMGVDPDWETRDAAAARILPIVVGYLRGSATLIPHALPVVGHLDDAIVVEAAWPSLAGEVEQYLAFCRIRHLEASLRGETRRHFGFTREQWHAAAAAEAGWIAHCHRVAQASYLLGAQPPRFRVS